MLHRKLFTSQHVCGDIFANRSMWTATCITTQSISHHHHAHSKIIPVSTATIRSGSSALCLIRNSPSSRVKISFVTAHKLYLSRSFKHNASIKAVFIICDKMQIRVRNTFILFTDDDDDDDDQGKGIDHEDFTFPLPTGPPMPIQNC